MSRSPVRVPARTLAGLLTALVLSTAPSLAQDRGPQPTCITGVRLGRGEDAKKVQLVLVDGRIQAVLDSDEETPKGMHLVDGEGLLALPAFVDAYTTTGVETPEPVAERDIPVDTGKDVRVDMREANRKGIEPSFRAAEALAIEASASEAWGEAGFGIAHVAPSGELLSGTSCVAETRVAAMRDLILVADAFQTAGFQARGRGYPSTLMGYIAQLQQFFLDSIRHGQLQERFEAGRPGPRPSFDPDLEAGLGILNAEGRLLCAAASHRDVERWFDLADQFHFRIAIVGDGDVWRAARSLAARKVPVILSLDWGKEVDDPDAEKREEKEEEAEESPGEESEEAAEEVSETVWEYTEPLGVRRERRRLWEEKRDAAIVLQRAGVPIVFGTKARAPKKLLEGVRELIEAGFAAEDALDSLTTGAAELLGLADRVGKLEPGYDATLALWSADPLTDKKAHVAWIFVEGYGKEFELPEEGADTGGAPEEGLDVSGDWTLTSTGEDGEAIEATLTLEMEEDGDASGKIVQPNPMEGGTMTIEVSGHVSGTTIYLEGTSEVQGLEIEFEYELNVDGDDLSGEATVHVPVMPEPITLDVSGHRNPEVR
ncbi:MAG TPA: hypothetical protein ENJ09_00430 [Planctomycetes bacterium]|nr:hypothetical protein [Planctomycetota bacterium]